MKGEPYQPIIHKDKSSVTAVSVTLAWEPNYDGGYAQTFSILYRTEYGGFTITENIKDPGMGNIVYSDKLNLSDSTCYNIKVISKTAYNGRSMVESETVDLCTKGLS